MKESVRWKRHETLSVTIVTGAHYGRWRHWFMMSIRVKFLCACG